MAQYEYKVVKCRVVDQQYYTSRLAAFGWQVQNMQEFVDQVVNQSLGFSYNTGNTNIFGRAYSPSHSPNTYFSGNQYSHGWGSQSNTSVTNVSTKLSITFFRDIEFPNRRELNEAETRWWPMSKRYLDRVINQGNTDGGREWFEFKELQTIEAEAWAIRKRSKDEKSLPPVTSKTTSQKSNQTENQIHQVPNIPATAEIKSMEITHNVFQSGQAGIQICLCFTIQNRRGLSCGIIAYFRDENGVGLNDLNNKFKTSNGKVSVGRTCTPEFDDAKFTDYLLFMPYAELDQPDGSRKLQFNIQIYDDAGKTFIAQSEITYFTFIKDGSNLRGEALAVAANPAITVKKSPPKPPTMTKSTVGTRSGKEPLKSLPPLSTEDRKAEFDTLVEMDKNDETRKLYLNAVFMDCEGKHTQAMKVYQRLLKLEPSNTEYIIAVSNSLFSQGKTDESMKTLEDGLSKLPGNPQLVYQQAMNYIRLKDFHNAEKAINLLSANEEKQAQFFVKFAQAYLSETRKEYKEAIRFYDQADKLAEDPEHNPMKGLGQQRCREMMK